MFVYIKHGLNHAPIMMIVTLIMMLIIMMMKTLMTMIMKNVEMTCVGGWVRPTSTV
jgi:hypothetical protein